MGSKILFLTSVRVVPLRLVTKTHFEKQSSEEHKIAPHLLGELVIGHLLLDIRQRTSTGGTRRREEM